MLKASQTHIMTISELYLSVDSSLKVMSSSGIGRSHLHELRDLTHHYGLKWLSCDPFDFIHLFLVWKQLHET